MTSSLPNTLYLDLGASLTKGFFALSGGAAEPLIMGSEVSGPLEASHLNAVKAFNTTSKPEVCAWIGLGKEAKETYAIGQFAQNFGGESWVDERKELRAVHKILAAIGVMKERTSTVPISGAGFSQVFPLCLGLLLPFSEFEDRTRILKELRAIKEFTFRGNLIKLELKDVLFRPEGFGLCLDAIKLLRSRGLNPDHRKILVVMAGHRNTSVLVFESGSFQSGKSTSTGPGFVEALTKGLQSRAFQKSDQPKLLNALVGGSPKVVLRGDKRLTDISESVKVGRDAYWSLLESFLTSHLTAHLDDRTFIVVGGGASQTVKPQMEDYLQGFGLDSSVYQIGFSGTVDDHLAQSLIPLVGDPKTELDALASRMSDSYAAFHQLLATRAKAPESTATPAHTAA